MTENTVKTAEMAKCSCGKSLLLKNMANHLKSKIHSKDKAPAPPTTANEDDPELVVKLNMSVKDMLVILLEDSQYIIQMLEDLINVDEKDVELIEDKD